ncbi:uncharacterized protein LOC133475182 isoform X4 [Phyllopteryx taeniolatus]|uniref:uncharacterized protein LOC133475182 isoform X4 n=1 Tax=Phyllopteryx taeniolatus TaxID=161469 RepID=UPI002AD41E54|nr:uncharacterized protein LOC133475182 isoform X4 [Phyllopteryx taeniolatus]
MHHKGQPVKPHPYKFEPPQPEDSDVSENQTRSSQSAAEWDERCCRVTGTPRGSQVSAGRRGAGPGPSGRHGPRFGLRGGSHPPARRGHHHRGIQLGRYDGERERTGEAAAAAAAAATAATTAAPAELRRAGQSAETEAPPDPLHAGAAQRAGAQLRQDALPGHLHEGGTGAQDRPDRVQSSGLVPEPPRQVEEEEEDHQRVPRPGHTAAHAGPAAVLGGRHGEQPVLVPRQRLALGDGHAGRVPAAAAAGAARPPAAEHGAVAVAVQPGPRPAAHLHGAVQRPLVQRLRPAVAPVPVAFPRHVGVALRPHERVGLPAAV